MKALRVGAIALVAALAAACASQDHTRTFYCTDEGGTVVSEDRCDGNGGGAYYLWHTSPGGTAYQPGQKVPLSSGERFPHNDQAAREKHNLGATGSVPNGASRSTGGNRGGGTGTGK